MSQWGAFVAFAVGLTIVLLVLARRSRQFVQKYVSDEQPVAGTTAEQPPTDSLEEPTVDTGPLRDGPDDTQSAPAREIELTAGMLLGNIAATQGLVAVTVVLAGFVFAIPASAFGVDSGTLARGLPGIGVGVAFGVALWGANELATGLADAIGATYDEQVRSLLAPSSLAGWGVLLGGVLPIIAVGEELLFRAALVGVPAVGFDVSPWTLGILSSFAFALGHGAQGRVGIAVTGVLGFALAGGYIVTESLLVVVVAHYVINALEFLVHECDWGALRASG